MGKHVIQIPSRVDSRLSLRNSNAHNIFKRNCGRGSRFEFSDITMTISTLLPMQIMIAIELSSTVLR